MLNHHLLVNSPLAETSRGDPRRSSLVGSRLRIAHLPQPARDAALEAASTAMMLDHYMIDIITVYDII